MTAKEKAEKSQIDRIMRRMITNKDYVAYIDRHDRYWRPLTTNMFDQDGVINILTQARRGIKRLLEQGRVMVGSYAESINFRRRKS